MYNMREVAEQVGMHENSLSHMQYRTGLCIDRGGGCGYSYLFTEEDLRVFKGCKALRGMGISYDEIRANWPRERILSL